MAARITHVIFTMALGVMSCSAAKAQDSDAATEYLDRPEPSSAIAALGNSPFGESIDLNTGALGLRQPDIVLKGTGPTISLVRTVVTEATDLLHKRNDMGDWMLSIPRIETFTHNAPGGSGINPGSRWVIDWPSSPTRFERCTRFNKPLYQSGITNPESAWHGMNLITPDGASRLILARAPQNTFQPTGFGVVPAVTVDDWQVACLPSTSNGEPGQAFLVIDPEGTRYWFDHLTGVGAVTAKEYDPFIGWIRQGRMLARMFATKIQDRHGNVINFYYGEDDRLDSIVASDGRSISLGWRSDARLIDHITVSPSAGASRTWHYEYLNPTGISPSLSRVLLPDATFWQFSNLSLRQPFSQTYVGLVTGCNLRTPGTFGTNYSGTITSPSGLTGTFTFGRRLHAASYVISTCVRRDSEDRPVLTPYEEIPVLSASTVLLSKHISGPGLAPAMWGYSYGGGNGSTTEDSCAPGQSCPSTRWTEELDPSGVRRLHTFSTRWGITEGQLMETRTFAADQSLKSIESYLYYASNAGPYPSRFGDSMLATAQSPTAKLETITPLKRRILEIVDQGTFTTSIDQVDARGRPVTTTRHSSN